MSESKKTAKITSIYAIGIIVNQMASFVMLPIYTRYLSPADYGVIELLAMTTDILGLITGAGLADAVFKFYYQLEQPLYKRKVICTAFLLSVSLYFIVGCLGFGFSDNLAASILQGTPEHSFAFRLIFVIFCLEPIHITTLLLFRLQERPKHFVTVGCVRLFIQLSLNIFFIVFMKEGFVGMLYSLLITRITLGIFLAIYFFRHVGLSFSIELAKKLLFFGAPIVIASIGTFIVTFSDRFFLKSYADLQTVGIYSLSYKLGFVLVTFAVTPFFSTWEPKRFQIAGNDNFQEVNQTVFFFFSAQLIFIALAIALFSRDLFRIMSAPDYVSAYKIVPLIMLAYIINSWTGYTNFGVYYCSKTKYLALTGIVSTIAVLVLSFVLIPPFKAYGAAWATILTFFLRFCMVYYFSQRSYALSFQWKKTIIMMLIASGVYLLALLALQDNIIKSACLNSCFLALFVVIVYTLPILDLRHKAYIKKMLRHPNAFFKEMTSES